LATVINDWFLARAAGQESVYRRIDYQLHIHIFFRLFCSRHWGFWL